MPWNWYDDDDEDQVEYRRVDIGEGYYLTMMKVDNMFGGYTYAGITLFHEGRFVRQITNDYGVFVDFPGVEGGEWESKLSSNLTPRVRFNIWFYPFNSDGRASIKWVAQPDGRYWEDDTGFGMTYDDEVSLIAEIDKEGKFVTKFTYILKSEL